MLDFEYFNPTRILFGPGKLTEIVKYIPENARILITYGEDSARKYGTLYEIRQILIHYTCFKFGGIFRAGPCANAGGNSAVLA
ncbi:hypothetical protein [Dickeya fangzhongdai]|uniref:hypothetical protein n=1 Tax=Dickeya fangzhongdai TaxID=1778540 RepID=UPI0026DF6BD0|nr:hypothetical protein [Dickeya fangzhongdai]WKV50448.1 hypothetical protein PL145_21835 [Dickeya fangzhongdai]